MQRHTPRQGQTQGQGQCLADADERLDYDEGSEIAADIFLALRRLAPERLRTLADGPNEATAITAWARAHRLAFAPLVREAIALRAHWEHSAAGRRTLSRGRLCDVTGRAHGAAYLDWAARVQLPDPALETLQDWRRRADALYREAAGLAGPRPPRWLARSTHAAWFVQTQVLRLKMDQIAGDEADEATVRKGVRRITEALCAATEKNLTD